MNIPILMAIDSATKFNHPKMLNDNTSSSIYKAILSVLNNARIKVVSYDTIVVDLDKPTGAATRSLKDNRHFEDIETEFPPTGTHVSELENANRHVRQRLRAKYA